MKYKIITLLIFLSSASVAYAGTWSSSVNYPGTPFQPCDSPPLYPTASMPVGGSCSPDGTTWTWGPMSMCDLGGGEFSMRQNSTGIQRQTCNPSANNPPTANAGIDRTITQPATSATPSGASASDPDGSVASTVWAFVSGPSSATISNGSTLTPTFNGLNNAGTYQFRLTVTDNLGLTAQDTMNVTVNVATPQCNDGIDNDGDGYPDSNDWGCHSDGNPSNGASYVPTDNDESNAYCNVPGWNDPGILAYDGDFQPGAANWCNGTPYGHCPTNLGGGPTSVSAKGSGSACCYAGSPYLGYVRGCIGGPVVPVSGSCGSSAGTTISSEPSGGAAACAAGTYSNSPADTGTNWNWTCTGTNGGSNASCTATKPVINGTCGPGAGNTTPTEPTGASACSAGTLNSSSPADTGTNWNWTCTGANGGSNASCTAPKTSGGTPGGCAYGIQATQTYSAKSLDELNNYYDGDWGIWAPVCASDTGWDSPHMNNARSFAATPAYGVPASEVSTFQSAMSSWFPQPGAWEEYDTTSGNTTRLSWVLDQWTGSQPDLIPCFAQVTINVCNTPPNYTLTTAVSPGGSGTVSATGISCPGDCTESYVAGTMVTVVATPAGGYSFSSWSGACAGQPSSCSLQMDGNKNTTANFVLVPTFDYSISNSGTSNVTKTAGDAYTTNTITRTLTSGTTEAVTISASGYPSGVSVSYDGNRTCSPNPSCVSTITFTVNSSAAAGTYNITVTSSGDGTPGPRNTNFNLVITQPAGLTVSCSANPTSALIGDDITWTASVSGGTPPYTYSWSGTDITGPAPTTNPYIKKYETIGTKTAAVTVTDTGSFQATCNPAAVTQINFDPSFEEF